MLHSPPSRPQHHGQRRQALQQCPHQRQPAKQRRGHIARRALHQVGLGGFVLKHHRTRRVNHQFQKRNMQRVQHGRPAQQHRQQRHAGNRHVHRQDVRHGLAQVVKNAPPQPHSVHQSCKVVVQQHDGRRLPRHVGAAFTHGHTHMRGLQGGRIVDPVAGHGHHLAAGFQGLNDAQLLRWGDAGADAHRGHALLQGGIAQLVQGIAGQQPAGIWRVCCDNF